MVCDGGWQVERHGVDPDIEVQNTPGDVLRGNDAPRVAGVRHVLAALKNGGYTLPPPSEFPVKAKPK